MDRAAHWFYRTAAAIARLLRLPLLCRLGMAAGWCAYYLLPPYRALALRNLEIAFGSEMTLRERRKLARRHFATLGANLLGSVGVSHMTPDQIRAVAEVEGVEIPERLLAAGKGCAFVIGHLGNWELFAQITPLLLKFPLGTVYQKLGNPFIDADVRTIRARAGLQLFERKEGFQGAIKMLRAAGGVGVLADQHAGDAGVWAPLFGRLASTTSLPAMLALRSGAALVPATIYSVRPGRWKVVFGEPIPFQSRDADELTAAINLNLEQRIRHSPADWFWVHNRWKTPKPNFLLAKYKRAAVLPATGELKPFRILIRSTNWLGDAVMSVPAVRAIKAGRPDAEVTILTPAKLAEVWKSVRAVDKIIPIEAGESVFTVAGKIRGSFDVAILFPNSLRAALEAWLAGIPRRVGYPGHRRAWLLNQVFREKKKKTAAPTHQVEHYLRLAADCGAETSQWQLADAPSGSAVIPAEPPPAPSKESAGEARPPRIAVCSGAEYGPAKRWLPERFAEVIKRISSETAVAGENGASNPKWTLVGVTKDAEIAAEIERLSVTPVTNLVGKTSLGELMNELRTSDALLTNDTGTMHLAALLGTPVIAIFGSTEPALTGPLGERHRVLRRHVECSPCFLRECPIDFRCMKAVTSEEAVRAVREVLQERQR